MPKLSVARIAPRDGRVCAHCGTTEALTVQHRAGKGMGGSAAAEALSNGCILCHDFNVLIEQDAAAAERARRMGWKVSRLGRLKPWEVPFWHAPTQGWRMVFNDGTWRPATAFEVREHLAMVAS